MQIRKITLRNLHSIRDFVEIDFTSSPLADTGLFAIIGDTGAGKTTILDAVTLALYGDVCRKSDAKEALSHGAEEGLAECEFEAKGRRFLAQWRVRQTKSKKPGQRFKAERSVAEWEEKSDTFHIVAERKVREVNNFIEDVTGLDFPRFTRSVMLAQGDFAAFLKANEKERSDLLERITGTEIYSELSKASLERKNLEKIKLDMLTEKRAALRILSKEEIREIKNLLKENRKEHKTVKKELEKSKEGLAWLLKIEQLKVAKNKIDNLKSNLEKEEASIQDDLQKLDRFKKTQLLHPVLFQLDEKQTEVSSLQNELTKYNLEIERLTEKEALEKKNFDAKKKSYEALKKNQPKAIRLFDKVSSLDTKIQSQSLSLLKQKKEIEEIKNQTEKSEKEIVEINYKIKTQKESLSELSVWLKENNHLTNLTKDLPSILHFRKSLGENYNENQALNKTISDELQQLKIARKAYSEKEKKYASIRKTIDNLQVAFKKNAPQEFAANRNDLLEKMGLEIETMSIQKQYLTQLNILAYEYQDLLTEINEMEEQLENLKKEETAFDLAFLTNHEETEIAENNLKYKQEIYRQQQTIANYEKDRAELNEGEPCPLCFSTEHPFRTGDFTPFVNKAREELMQAEAFYKNKQNDRNNLIKRLLEISSQTRQLDSSSSGRLLKLQNKLIETEQKIAALSPYFEEKDFALSTGNWIANKLSGFEQKLKAKKEARAKLAELNSQLSKEEAALQLLEINLKDSQIDLVEKEKSVQHKQQNAKVLENKFIQQTDELNKILNKYGKEFNLDSASKMFSELEQQANNYSNKSDQKNRIENQLKLDEQASRQLNDSLQLLLKKSTAIQKDYNFENNILFDLKNNRNELFGNKDPNTEREELIHKIEKHEKDLNHARESYTQTKELLNLTQQSIAETNKQLEKNNKIITEVTNKIEKALSKTGIKTIEMLRATILPENVVIRIQNKVDKIKEQKIQINQQLKTIEKEQEKTFKKTITEKEQNELNNEIQSLEKKLEETQKNIGGLEQQLKANDSLEEEAKKLLEEIDTQRDDYNRWMALYDLIGSSDGKKFRIFAQGLTLQKLVQLANVHLKNLYDRYFIIKREGEDLELDIVDTYQADNTRSMHTLSGGESFLVSLALALGLSDLAGKNANIKSLFIDEGFGTLDEQALDLALNTLENLQSKGKTIGIISHVKELKERISTQVKVIKKGGGTSHVEVVG